MRERAEQLGGRLELASNDAGTRLTVTLPWFTPMKKTRILLVDDHQVVRRGVAGVIGDARPEWEVCGEASTGREAVAAAASLKPDVVVMDISMPDMNGLEATREILKNNPGTEVLILSVHESEQMVHDVLGAGARGYILKQDAGTDLIRPWKQSANTGCSSLPGCPKWC